MAVRISSLVPVLEAYIKKGMAGFDDPGLAIGIVQGDKLAYARAFGVRRKGGEPVTIDTVFQIGSITKSFLATTLAIGVDRKMLAWDDRVIDLYPDFQMKDPWVSREFRVFDLLAQRSGLPSAANDLVVILGADHEQMIHSLRFVDPVSSFRSTFAYTNLTHIVAQHVLARRVGAPNWQVFVRSTIFEPLGMKNSSFTAEAIEAAPNHSQGHRWTASGTIEVPFTPVVPYAFDGAGAINSSVTDLVQWVRLHLAGGTFEGREIVSARNLAVTKTPRISISDSLFYAMGWLVQVTPNGRSIWHNGGTPSFGAYIGMAPDKDVGVIVLTNEHNAGLPDAVGEWVLDRLMDNPKVDHVAAKLEAAKAADAATVRVFDPPPAQRPSPPLHGLAGSYVNGSFGQVELTAACDGLVLNFTATGAKLKIEPRDGDVFTASLIAEGRFAAIATNLGPLPLGFVQPLVGKDGTFDQFSFIAQEDGQTYLFTRR